MHNACVADTLNIKLSIGKHCSLFNHKTKVCRLTETREGVNRNGLCKVKEIRMLQKTKLCECPLSWDIGARSRSLWMFNQLRHPLPGPFPIPHSHCSDSVAWSEEHWDWTEKWRPLGKGGAHLLLRAKGQPFEVVAVSWGHASFQHHHIHMYLVIFFPGDHRSLFRDNNFLLQTWTCTKDGNILRWPFPSSG